ncbi:sodium:proton antiporter [Tautonia marina]|uniref:sodium:proton antiporter n=1 Tax=Tautonia marina TaxID=2653855 RepID=UPI0012607443|nr:NADH-quinone oxidoreductase subunit K [Tautonia marina]
MIGLGVLFIALLTAVSLYLMMSSDLQRIIMGFVVLSNAANLVILVSSGLSADAVPPLLDHPSIGTLTDPLPHAFVLTAIVIGLGNAAFLIVLASRIFRETGSDIVEGGPGA